MQTSETQQGKAPAERPRRRVADATRERILDSAEILFAHNGFHGTTLREVARESNAGLALVTHHFESKALLLERVVERRSSYLGMVRINALDRARKDAGNRPITARQLIESYVGPHIERSQHGGPGWKNYSLLLARLGYSEEHGKLISAHFDAVARVYLEEFKRAVPSSSEEAIHHAFGFMVNAMMGILAGSRSVEQLSLGKVSGTNMEEVYQFLVQFADAGFQAVCSPK